MCGGIIFGTLAPSRQKNFIAETGSEIIPPIFARAKKLSRLDGRNYPAGKIIIPRNAEIIPSA